MSSPRIDAQQFITTVGLSRHFPPSAIFLLCAIAMLFHGPIAQITDYHHFADRRYWWGLPNAADVLSNLGFLIVGIVGLQQIWRGRHHAALQTSRSGYVLFFASLVLTAIGSSWYHLAPDNARLVFDRLPIALACGGLLAAVWQETAGQVRGLTVAMAMFAIAGVAWWRFTDLHGVGDLRPYLLLQALPLVLIPLLQYQSRRPRAERMAFAVAIWLYVLAKICEVNDHAMFDVFAFISGHTLKHLLASLAAAILVWSLHQRLRTYP